MGNIITKQPIGKIKMIKYFQPKRGGVILNTDDVYDYYGTITTSTGCGCNGTLQNMVNYRIDGNILVPEDKAVIIE